MELIVWCNISSSHCSLADGILQWFSTAHNNNVGRFANLSKGRGLPCATVSLPRVTNKSALDCTRAAYFGVETACVSATLSLHCLTKRPISRTCSKQTNQVSARISRNSSTVMSIWCWRQSWSWGNIRRLPFAGSDLRRHGDLDLKFPLILSMSRLVYMSLNFLSQSTHNLLLAYPVEVFNTIYFTHPAYLGTSPASRSGTCR